MLWILIGSGLPALLLLFWCYRQDKEQPEPLRLVAKGVFFGILGTIPVIVMELVSDLFAGIFPPILREAYTAFVVAGFIEEGTKYFIIKKFFYPRPEFDQVMDGIVYAFCVSLGFAFAENFLYGLGNSAVLIIRAFTAVPMHAFSTGIMGYWLGMQKMEQTGQSGNLGTKGLTIAVIVHGLYDFCIFIGIPLLAILVLVVSGLFLGRAVRASRILDKRRLLAASMLEQGGLENPPGL